MLTESVSSLGGLRDLPLGVITEPPHLNNEVSHFSVHPLSVLQYESP
jgi:hypothetical protein